MHIPDPAIFKGHRATGYDNFVLTYIPFYRGVMSCLPSLINQNIVGEEEPILVVGCGTGNELLELSQAYPTWKLEGIDPSPEMVAQARKKLNDHTNVRLINGYVNDLPTPPQYRAATMLLVLHFVPDNGAKLALLRDLAERMLPGAPLILMDIFGSSVELISNLSTLLAMMPPTSNPAKVTNRLKTLPDRIEYISEHRLTSLLLEAGFRLPQRFFQAAIYGGWITRRDFDQYVAP